MTTEPCKFRFGPYEVHPGTRELYKHGRKLKLRQQAFQVLLALVERAGNVVTREQLRDRVWTSDTFVDFEHGLNTAIKELRATLNDSAAEPRYIETLPKLGYRMVAVVEKEVKEVEEVKEVKEIKHAERAMGDDQPKNWWRWKWAAAAVLGLCAIALLGIWMQKRRMQTGKKEVTRLAVLPLENLTGDPSQEYFSDGLTEEMIAKLGRIDPQRLEVIARTSVMQYKHTQEPLDRIARELGVQYVLEGSVRRDGDTVRITEQLIQVQNQAHLWSREYDRQRTGLLTLQSEIAQEIGDEIQVSLGQRPNSHKGRAPANASAASYEAYDLYLKGRYYWNKRTEAALQQAANYFREAIQKDPNYASAYAGLADTFALQGTWSYLPTEETIPKARAAALKALQIDDGLAEAHASLGLIAEQHDYDWQTAEREFRRAIELDPDYATGHQWYAECLSLQGQFKEALAESERARQLDPLSLIIATDHGLILFYSRQYDRAIEQLRAVREMDVDFPRSSNIFSAYIEKGDFATALTELEGESHRHHLENSRGAFASKTYLYGRWRREADAQRAFANYEKAPRLQGAGGDPAWMELYAYMGVDRKDDAIAVLEQEYKEHSSVPVTLKVDPLFDPLRGDPRFQELLRNTHLSQ